MSKRLVAVLILAVLLAGPALAGATELPMNALVLRDGSSVDLGFIRSSRAPNKSAMQATVSFSGGQSSITLKFQKMEPAVLFAGDISAYVLWAVLLDGSVENLGEVAVDKKNASGSQTYYTGRRNFALMVTAEPYSTVTGPTDIVLFHSSTNRTANAQYTPFTFRGFTGDAKPALESIAMFQYNDSTPAAVRQADKVIQMAEKLNAAEVNPKAVDGARIAFGKAMATSDKRLQADQARAAAQLASQAIKDVLKAREEKAAAEAEAKRLAERAALEERASTAESESARIARQLKEVELQRQALAAETADLAKLTEKLTAEKAAIAAERDAVTAERDRVAADREAIRKERDELASRLKGALSTVADTTETARGVVVSLSGILFDLGKASLMPASQISVAKLAGILTVFPQMNLSIEGYTDSTGSLELNMRLSTERARTVYEFLLGQGIAADRMKYQGFGPENPVAPNDTEANRAKNRRVEVVLTQAVR